MRQSFPDSEAEKTDTTHLSATRWYGRPKTPRLAFQRKPRLWCGSISMTIWTKCMLHCRLCKTRTGQDTTQDTCHTGLHDCYVWMTPGQLLSQKKPEFAIYLLLCRYLESKNLYTYIGCRISDFKSLSDSSPELGAPQTPGRWTKEDGQLVF